MVIMKKQKVLIFIVCYYAEDFIKSVLDRIPDNVLRSDLFLCEVLIVDDGSTDCTFERAAACCSDSRYANVNILYNPRNQGYGGNQKIGYHYAMRNGFDVVVLLHGDGQYPPEKINDMVLPIIRGEADAVFGSRMLNKTDALKGGMPLYKWLGNQVLTFIQNKIIGSNLSEFHTGYRAFSVSALSLMPFVHNSDEFDFDTDIIIQLLDAGKKIKEIPVPTFYGSEVCRVDGFKYARKILCACILSRIMRLGVFYHPKFDYESPNERYGSKFNYPSSHSFALERACSGMRVLDVGCGTGFVAEELHKKGIRVVSIDRTITPRVEKFSERTIQADLETYDFSVAPLEIDKIFALDIIEHLGSPEDMLGRIKERYGCKAPDLIVTTGNIAFFLIRWMLFIGQFNYGKRGILDLDHARLFTFSSLKRLLKDSGYTIVETKGLPAPFPLALGDTRVARMLLNINSLLIAISKSLFAYQIGIVAKPKPTLDSLLQHAIDAGEKKCLKINSNPDGSRE